MPRLRVYRPILDYGTRRFFAERFRDWRRSKIEHLRNAAILRIDNETGAWSDQIRQCLEYAMRAYRYERHYLAQLRGSIPAHRDLLKSTTNKLG